MKFQLEIIPSHSIHLHFAIIRVFLTVRLIVL